MSPYDPRPLHAAITVTRHADTVTAPDPLGQPATAVLVPADPGRVWLLIQCYDRQTAAVAVPVPFGGTGGLTIPVGASHLLIHAASLPGMLAGAWHVFISTAPGYGVFTGSNYFSEGGG